MNYSTYILYSKLRNRYYIGYSQDPIARLEEHNSGATISTRSGRPWQLVYQEDFDNKTQAIKRESEIKRKKSRKYIESLIRTKLVG
jgi:putative endonuclease